MIYFSLQNLSRSRKVVFFPSCRRNVLIIKIINGYEIHLPLMCILSMVINASNTVSFMILAEAKVINIKKRNMFARLRIASIFENDQVEITSKLICGCRTM